MNTDHINTSVDSSIQCDIQPQSANPNQERPTNRLIVERTQGAEQAVARVTVDFPSSSPTMGEEAIKRLQDQIDNLLKNFLADPANTVESARDKADASTQTIREPSPVREAVDFEQNALVENEAGGQPEEADNGARDEPVEIQFEIIRNGVYKDFRVVMENARGISMEEIHEMSENMAEYLESLFLTGSEFLTPPATNTTASDRATTSTEERSAPTTESTSQESQRDGARPPSFIAESGLSDGAHPSSSTESASSSRIRRRSKSVSDETDKNDAKKSKKSQESP
ncbi:unnamed protein product [Caenorhabditis bovis]|uniref:Uncharacterized protein n=1 Tax=Caenorhabditis bovis TaxID=2654633 RepID=A0A8S1FCG7_9PELO|nr:unnamed protein product [Caenorhabditis bovis]